MRRGPLALLVVLVFALVGDHVIFAQNPPCDPDRDRRNPNLQAAKEAKKAQLRRRGYPERFMKLIDQEECIACVRTASDAFHIMIVYKDNDFAPVDPRTGNHWTHVSTNWSPGMEIQARDQTKAGKIQGFYISNTLQRDCKCCPDVDDKRPEDYSDWNEDLSANMSHLIPFDQSNLNGPLPDDLVNPDQRWVGEPPPEIHVFTKPPKKQAHALCPACQADIDKLNAAYDALDSLFSEKIAVLEARQRNEQDAARNENEIRLLWFRQRSAQMRSDANAKRIDELEAANEKLKSEMRAQWQQVEALDDRIVAQRASLAALETATAAECERKCKVPTTAIAETPPPSITTPASPVTPSPVTPPSTSGAVTPSAPPAVAECPECSGPAGGVQTATRELAVALAAVPPNTRDIELWQQRLRDARTALQSCNLSCKKPVPPPPAVTPRPDAAAKCSECDVWIQRLNAARGYLEQSERRKDLSDVSKWQLIISDLLRSLENCNNSCTNVEQPVLPPAEVFTPKPAPPVDACFGDTCAQEFASCTDRGDCPAIEDECRGLGECVDNRAATDGGLPWINLAGDSGAWTTSINIEIDTRVQEKLTDVFGQPSGSWYEVPPTPQQGVMQWFNPLGLLARRLVDHIDRWRGSVAPRPLLTPRDLEVIDRVSNAQAAGLPRGVHVLLTDQGGSTGKTLVMSVLNLTGQKVRLSTRPFAVQPVKQQAQQQAMQAFNRLAKAAPTRIDLNAYCVEFLKLPPGPGTLLRLAPANVQQKYASMSKILQSAYRVSKGNGLHPDSNPAAYTDAMKQWAVWTVEQNFNEARFTDAFLGHTKKNVEAAKQPWSKQAEEMIRQASPNRWRDIARILQGAGVPVPR